MADKTMRVADWKRGWTVAACLAVAALVTGCSGFWQAPSSGGSTTLSSKDFYILNGANIYGGYIDSGTLTALTSSPYALPGTPTAIAMDTTGSYLYVAITGTGVVSYVIDSSTGALTEYATVATDLNPLALAVDPSGEWLLDASGQGYLNAIPISAGKEDSTRNIQSSSALTSPTTVKQVAVEPNGGRVFVAEGSGGTDVFAFTSGNAKPVGTTRTNYKTKNSSGSALSVAVDPSSRLLYIGETAAVSSSGGLRVFTITSSKLTELAASPYASGGPGPHAILPAKNGSYVYVANWNGTSSGNITGFTVTTTALTKIGSVATGSEPVSLAEDGSGNFVLAVNGKDSTSLDAYYFDTTTSGQLDLGLSASTSTTGTGPVAVVAVP